MFQLSKRAHHGPILAAAHAHFNAFTTEAPLMAGIKVIELANVLAGPTVCQFLAELGADVIKIENTTTQGDVTRTWQLPTEKSNDTTVTSYFSCCNVGKKSVALDLRDPRGLDIVHRMVREADIVVASYKPGDADKLQVDYDTLKALNPLLVYAQINGYGSADARAGYDAVIQAESGFQYMNGTTSPTKMPVALVDLLAAHQLKEGILGSMWKRERDGVGNVITVSLMQSAVSALANQGTGFLRAHAVPQRIGSDHPSICPYGTVFQCKDEQLITFAVGSDKQFQQLCAILGVPDMAYDSKFKTNPNRVQHRDECKARLASLVLQFNRQSLLEQLQQHAVPAGGVNDMADVFALPQAKAMVVTDAGNAPMGIKQVAFESGLDVHASGGGGSGDSGELLPPPEYGQHTVEVVSKYVSETELKDLMDAKIIEQRCTEE